MDQCAASYSVFFFYEYVETDELDVGVVAAVVAVVVVVVVVVGRQLACRR